MRKKTPTPKEKLVPTASFVPGLITIYLPEIATYSFEEVLAPHRLTREEAVAVRDSLNVALEDEAAVRAVLSR